MGAGKGIRLSTVYQSVGFFWFSRSQFVLKQAWQTMAQTMSSQAGMACDHDSIAARLVELMKETLKEAIARCVASTQPRELLLLCQGREGTLKCTHPVLDTYKPFLANLFKKFGPNLPRTK